jgi:hypothetical protein
MKTFRFFLVIAYCSISLFSCQSNSTLDSKNKSDSKQAQQNETAFIHSLLDSLNIAAAHADFQTYFSYYTDDAHFLGTDATENWDKSSFMDFAKPYFDKGKAWTFTSLQRNIYFADYTDLAWFDELLQTQMKLCRGSGVVVKQDGRWKIKHYVLSMTIPNSEVKPVIDIKTIIEDSLISDLKKLK